MKLFIFSVRDRATDMFGTPMFLQTAGQAIRSFSDEVNREDAQNMLNTHPDDFDLYDLGIFDTDTGLFETGVPKQIAIGKMIRIKK